MRLLILFFGFLLFSSALLAQVSAPKYSNEFLAIGVGARAQAMGNTQIAVADDVTSGYWNPAGLLNQQSDYEVMLEHGEYYSGIAKFDYLGFSMPLDTLSNLGFSVIRFGIDDIPDTRFLYDANGAINYDNISFFSAADYAFMASYARRLPSLAGLRLGGSVKVIHRNAGDFASAWGFGIDIGAQWAYKKWSFAGVFRDATGTFTAWSHNADMVRDVYTQTGNIIPQNSVEVTVPRLIFGVGRLIQIKKVGILPTVDFSITFDGKRNTLVKSNFASIDPRFGLEVNYGKIAFFRFGLHNVQQLKNFDSSTYWIVEPTFGIGIHYQMVTLDYALSALGQQTESLYSHIFSLKLAFNNKE